MPVIKDWIADAASQLSKAGIPSAQLDAEILLAFAIDKDRTYLHAYPEKTIQSDKLDSTNRYIKQRINRIPIAYIVGMKEFYGRNFIVDNNTLIPRPESESLIELLNEILLSTNYNLSTTKLLDVGTGSGCLGITAKLELPDLDVTLSDISKEALSVAKTNAKLLSADVKTVQSNLFSNIDTKFDIIIANLPYVDITWQASPEIRHEPDLALFAEDDGLMLIKKMIVQSTNYLSPNGLIILESDPRQHQTIIDFALQKSFILDRKSGFILSFISLS